MSKTSINRKAAVTFITNERNNGKSEQEIYNELSQQYYDKKRAALLITGTVTPELKQKYKVWNNILLCLLCLTAFLKILWVFSLAVYEHQPLLLLLALVVPIFNIYFIYEIARYNAPAYRFCALLTIVSIVRSINENTSADTLALGLVLSASIAGLAFYLDTKMFPAYSPKNLKKDGNGEYVLPY